MADVNLGEVAASVWEHKFGTKPTDNIFNSCAFFYSMGEDGFKEEADGGRLFEHTVEYAENTNFHSIAEMDELDTSRIPVFDAARFNQKIHAGTVVLSELEKLRSQAKGGKFDLLASKLDNGKKSHIADMNRALLGSATTGNDINGLQVVISSTPTTGSVGGISRDTFSFWRNRQNSGAASVSAFDNLRSALTTTYNQCSLGGVENTPRWVLMDRSSFQGYELILVAIEQIAEAKMKASGDIAFKNDMLRFKGAFAFFDEDAPASSAYLYNNTNLKVDYLKGGWMKMFPARNPYNQLTQVHPVMTVANLGTNASRHLGVVTSIS